MTEAEARAALRAFVGVGNVEPWIAEQSWKAAQRGWTVARELEGWRFRLEVVPGGVRVIASTPGGGEPAVWVVPRFSTAPGFTGCAKPRRRSPAMVDFPGRPAPASGFGYLRSVTSDDPAHNPG